MVSETVNIAQHVDLMIGVVPVINLEWIQKLHRDRIARRHSTEAVTDTILRRIRITSYNVCYTKLLRAAPLGGPISTSRRSPQKANQCPASAGAGETTRYSKASGL